MLNLDGPSGFVADGVSEPFPSLRKPPRNQAYAVRFRAKREHIKNNNDFNLEAKPYLCRILSGMTEPRVASAALIAGRLGETPNP